MALSCIAPDGKEEQEQEQEEKKEEEEPDTSPPPHREEHTTYGWIVLIFVGMDAVFIAAYKKRVPETRDHHLVEKLKNQVRPHER